MEATISKEARAILDDPVASKQLHEAVRVARAGQDAILEVDGKRYQLFTDGRKALEARKKFAESR